MSNNSFYLSDLIGIKPTEKFAAYAKVLNSKPKNLQEFNEALDTFENLLQGILQGKTDSLYAKASTADREQLLSPTVVFENGYVYDDVKGKREFIVSLGIFNLDTTSATATITKDNKLELTWTERAGKGKFTSKIPSYLVATSSPVLSYEGGVLDIRVPVESRSKNEAVFVGKLKSKS